MFLARRKREVIYQRLASDQVWGDGVWCVVLRLLRSKNCGGCGGLFEEGRNVIKSAGTGLGYGAGSLAARVQGWVLAGAANSCKILIPRLLQSCQLCQLEGKFLVMGLSQQQKRNRTYSCAAPD